MNDHYFQNFWHSFLVANLQCSVTYDGTRQKACWYCHTA
uniref:Uncharacterized protein n=1 Tax=Arundo donax TaxID=35708 RepID=A0A0A9HC49_ARUDO